MEVRGQPYGVDSIFRKLLISTAAVFLITKQGCLISKTKIQIMNEINPFPPKLFLVMVLYHSNGKETMTFPKLYLSSDYTYQLFS